MCILFVHHQGLHTGENRLLGCTTGIMLVDPNGTGFLVSLASNSVNGFSCSAGDEGEGG